MKVSCILLSYNRPIWLRHALSSVACQTHRDYQLIIVDESTVLDVHEVVSEFSLSDVEIHKVRISPEERKKRNPVGANLNLVMDRVRGELVCFLCDDDYFYPTWFQEAAYYFRANPHHHAGFGILVYSRATEMCYPDIAGAETRFFTEPVKHPFCKLDHTQVIHRTFRPPYRWPEEFEKIKEPDGYYFTAISRDHAFHPIPTLAVVKREHSKALRWNVDPIASGTLEELRE